MKKTLCILFCLFFCLCGCSMQKPPVTVSEDAAFKAYFLDTGNSDCIILQIEDANILIDAADTDDSDLILNKLRECGITTLDYFIITHFDNDHIGSAARVIYEVETKKIYAPDYVRDSKRYDNMMKAANERCGGIEKLTEDISFSVGNAEFKIYVSNVGIPEDDNSYSMIVSVHYGENSFLFAADATEECLIEFNKKCSERFDLVKSPHHGNFNQGVNAMLNAAHPDYCVVCTDMAESVEPALPSKVQDIGSKFFLTYNGEVTALCDGKNVQVKQIAK